jgi:hypothetical protein
MHPKPFDLAPFFPDDSKTRQKPYPRIRQVATEGSGASVQCEINIRRILLESALWRSHLRTACFNDGPVVLSDGLAGSIPTHYYDEQDGGAK